MFLLPRPSGNLIAVCLVGNKLAISFGGKRAG